MTCVNKFKIVLLITLAKMVCFTFTLLAAYNSYCCSSGCLQNSPVLTQRSDRIKWGSNKDGSYSVKEGYLLLSSNKDLIDQWPWKLIWKINLPPKVSCFCWVALKRACLTLDNLMKRKFHLANRCYMCHCTSETINHLFLHCPVATGVEYVPHFVWFAMGYTLHCQGSFCLLEFLESWEGHQKNLVYGPCLHFVVLMVGKEPKMFSWYCNCQLQSQG